MMKTIIALLLAGSLTFGLAACGNSESSASDASSTATATSSQASSEAPASSNSEEQPQQPPQMPLGTIQEEDPTTFAQRFEQLYQGTQEADELPLLTMETSMGTIKIVLFPEQAPKTVENIVELAKKGYYDGLTFHRVIDDFMIQGGDPTGTGAGGESFFGSAFQDEFSDLLHNFRGSLSMANAGYSTNGSQFFIVQAKDAFGGASEADMLETMYMNRELYLATMQLQAAQQEGKTEEELNKLVDELNAQLNEKMQAGVPAEYGELMQPVMALYRELGGTPYLDYKHTVFGFVVEGMEVVDAIAAVKTENDKPVEDVIVQKVTV
ncbi:MAG: peptidylprolyl isomerase [Anaerotruncus sp.]|nr:peptidylprolyl isomerase [Anaerotruncus sp.]